MMTLYWTTENGNDWLAEELPSEATPESLDSAVRNYMLRTQETAARLVEGWRRNGEDVSLWPAGNGSGAGETYAICQAIDRVEAALANTGYEPRDCGEKLKP